MGRHTYVSALLHLINPTVHRHIVPSGPLELHLAGGFRRVGRHARQRGDGWGGFGISKQECNVVAPSIQQITESDTESWITDYGVAGMGGAGMGSARSSHRYGVVTGVESAM